MVVYANGGRAIPVIKKGIDIRPIVIGNIQNKVAIKEAMNDSADDFKRAIDPTQIDADKCGIEGSC